MDNFFNINKVDRTVSTVKNLIDNSILIPADFQFKTVELKQLYIECLVNNFYNPNIHTKEISELDSTIELVSHKDSLKINAIIDFLNDKFEYKNFIFDSPIEDGKKYSELSDINSEMFNNIIINFECLDNQTDFRFAMSMDECIKEF